jgi:hypothetical protein
MLTLLSTQSGYPVKPYVPVRMRIAAPFMSAYAPVTPAPDPMAVAMTAACLSLLMSMTTAPTAPTVAVAAHTRRNGSVPVRQHTRRARLSRRLPDEAVTAQCDEYDRLQGARA